MKLLLQCFYCGEFVTLVGPRIFAGHVDCPSCHELGIYIIETDLTPRPGPFDVEETFEVVRTDEGSV